MLLTIFTACTPQAATPAAASGDAVTSEIAAKPLKEASISFWTLPYFAVAGGAALEEELIAAFRAIHPEVEITFHSIEPGESGNKELLAAGASGQLDVLYDSAERLASFAREQKLADLSSLYTEELTADLPENIVLACGMSEIKYMMPISVSPYLMAFNKEMLEGAGLLPLLPYERSADRAWTIDEYTVLLKGMKEKLAPGISTPVLFANSSAGDAATRSLITNLYGAEFINGEYTEYTIGSSEGKEAFSWLNKTVQEELLVLDEKKSAIEAVEDFVQGYTPHTILYTVGLANNYADHKKDGFTEILMPYPGQSGAAVLEYSLSGFAAFDNGDEARLEAARAFIDFIANDRQVSRMAAASTGGISPRLSKNELRYEPEYLFAESLKQSLGRHSPVMEGFSVMQSYWFKLVAAAVKKDAKTDTLLDAFVKAANQTIADAAKKREGEQP